MKNKEFTFGDECKMIGPETVIVDEITYFDELEYDCWNLITNYAKAFGFEFDDEIDFYATKEVQKTILKLFEGAGVKFKFGGDK